jgi:diadenosine tetraphosphate (Ap4A) HIT family hydrolase
VPDQNPIESGVCAFCDLQGIAQAGYVLHEGEDFYVITDYAPIAEAHLLLIPRDHYPHLAGIPASLHDEFESLKLLLGDFVRRHNGQLVYWENGVFGQTVPHAHLHVVSLSLDQRLYQHAGPSFTGIHGLQELHLANGGHYFTLEQAAEARFLPPDPELYVRIIHHGQERSPYWLRNRDERRLKGQPLIERLKQRWLDEMTSLVQSAD